jgi:drug/metabolite transporter (DMT)-like permease
MLERQPYNKSPPNNVQNPMGTSVHRLACSPYFLLILTTLFWSGNFVLGRAVHQLFSPIALSFWRWALALLILLPFAWTRLHAQWPLLLRHWQSLTLLGILGVANFNTFVYTGLQSTTATNAVLLVSTTPVVIVALSFLLLHLTVTRQQILGIGLSLLGVVVIVTKGSIHALLAQRLNPGDLWVMAAVLSWALYSVCLKWRPAGLHPLTFLAATVIVGVVALLPFYGWDLSRGTRLEINGVTLASISYVAIFPSILAYIFWNRAVAELGANRTGQFLHLMPAFGAILAFLLLDEKAHYFHMVGITLIASGIYLTTVRHPRAV